MVVAAIQVSTCTSEKPIPRHVNHQSREFDSNTMNSTAIDSFIPILSGVRWGRPDVLFTPAYWVSQLSMHPELQKAGVNRLGETFREEVIACMLGGHGIPAEVGLAAFLSLKNSGLIESQRKPGCDEVYQLLARPMTLSAGRQIRYRFAARKSGFIASFLASFDSLPPDSSHTQLRNWLTSFHGIGLKTASWVIRNWFDSDEVAVLDVHIHRAGLLAGFFHKGQSLSRSYLEMESRFLDFCRAIDVRASALDALIWSHMRRASNLAIRCLDQ